MEIGERIPQGAGAPATAAAPPPRHIGLPRALGEILGVYVPSFGLGVFTALVLLHNPSLGDNDEITGWLPALEEILQYVMQASVTIFGVAFFCLQRGVTLPMLFGRLRRPQDPAPMPVGEWSAPAYGGYGYPGYGGPRPPANGQAQQWGQQQPQWQQQWGQQTPPLAPVVQRPPQPGQPLTVLPQAPQMPQSAGQAPAQPEPTREMSQDLSQDLAQGLWPDAAQDLAQAQGTSTELGQGSSADLSRDLTQGPSQDLAQGPSADLAQGPSQDQSQDQFQDTAPFFADPSTLASPSASSPSPVTAYVTPPPAESQPQPEQPQQPAQAPMPSPGAPVPAWGAAPGAPQPSWGAPPQSPPNASFGFGGNAPVYYLPGVPRPPQERGRGWQFTRAYFISMAGVLGFLISVIIYTQVTHQQTGAPDQGTSPLLILVGLVVALAAGFGEEMLVTGLVTNALEAAGMTGKRAWVIYAVAICLRIPFHLYYGWASLGVIIFTVVNIYVYRRWRLLWPIVLAHATYDFFEYVGGIVPQPAGGLLILGLGLGTLIMLICIISVENSDRLAHRRYARFAADQGKL